jgi:hypothetical protein
MYRMTFALALGLLAGSAWNRDARAQDTAWGTVKGQVVWGDDTVPERKPINVDKNQDHCLAKGPLLSEEWVVNPKNKGIRWTFVWLAPATKGGKLPIHPDLAHGKTKPVIIDQPCCMFEPHAVGIQEGQELIVKNSAPIPHNVNWQGGLKNRGNNVIVPSGGEIKIDDLKAEKYPVKLACNIHGWMSGWVRIFDHPYFAVTDADGKFEMPKAPVGDYRLVVWHESLGWLGGAAGKDGQPITITAGAPTDVGALKVKP